MQIQHVVALLFSIFHFWIPLAVLVVKKIHTDLYKKPTDRNQYLLTSSCHPSHVCESIPFSLALRIVRICSTIEAREVRFSELKEMLLAREYSAGVINAAISRARSIPRNEALKKVFKAKNSDRPVLTIQYHPALPSLAKIINRHYRTMTLDPHMKSVFPQPPLVAYKRQKNLREYLIRAKVPPVLSRPKRTLPGMKKCNGCTYCSYIQTGDHVTSAASDYHHQIHQSVNCNTSNVIYLITCLKCSVQYVGETDRRLKDRFCEHKSYVTSKKQQDITSTPRDIVSVIWGSLFWNKCKTKTHSIEKKESTCTSTCLIQRVMVSTKRPEHIANCNIFLKNLSTVIWFLFGIPHQPLMWTTLLAGYLKWKL